MRSICRSVATSVSISAYEGANPVGGRAERDSPKRQTSAVQTQETTNAGWDVEWTWDRKVRGRKRVKNGEKRVLERTLTTAKG
jgi:hypothetical protein